MSSPKPLKTAETQTLIATLYDDHIIRVMLKKGSDIDLEKAQENIRAYIDIAAGNKYAFLVYAEDDTVIYTDEARKNAKVSEAMFPKYCIAVVVKTLAHKLVANFYFKFYKPGYPFKVFTKISDAEKWCYKILAENGLNYSAIA